MKISRNEQEVVETPKQTVDSLEAGTVFKIGKKLYLKLETNGYDAQAARLTSGEVEEFSSETVADEIVDGTFQYA